MRVGLVMGAGGLKGMAWLSGALQALERETGWDPAGADHVVGTSAGAMVGTLLAASRDGADGPDAASDRPRARRGAALTEDVDRDAASNGDRADRAAANGAAPASDNGAFQPGWPPENLDRLPIYRLHRGVPRPGPGSWPLALSTLMRPNRHTPGTVLSAWLPAGVLSTEPIAQAVRKAAPRGFDTHPRLWIMACDYSSGRRVAFGREGAPEAELDAAVAASCAIPGSYRPVEIGGRRYVDGGMYSTSNLDVVREEGLDLVVCLNPTSSLHPTRAWNPLEQVAAAWRTESGRRLGSESRKLRERGTEVVLIQPTAEDLAVIGPNLMSRRGHPEVMATALRTTSHQLRQPEVAERLAGLGGGVGARARPAGARRPGALASTRR